MIGRNRFPLYATLLLAVACADPTSMERADNPQYARAPRPTTGSTTVTSTNPMSSPRGVTLDVRILGSGFDAGSKAQLAIKGVPSSKVVTNSTRFVSSGEVVANITIAADADITLYDVIVTAAASGKPGIGTETFQITIEEADLPTAGGAYGAAVAINDQSVIVGASTDRAADRNGTTYPVRWNLVGGKWTITKLTTVASVEAIANAINESNYIVGMSNSRATAWLPGGGSVDLGPGCATGINANNWIVGAQRSATGLQGVVWIPSGSEWVAYPIAEATDPNTGAMYACEFSPLRGINSAGVVVGYPRQVATKWIPAGSPGVWSSEIILAYSASATAINEAGDIIGNLNRGGGDIAPHLWRVTGEEVHYSDIGSGIGFGRGLNDHGWPDVVAQAGGGRAAIAVFGGAQVASRLNRFAGGHDHDGAIDVNNGTATQPMRIVGAVVGKPKVWTYR